MKCARCGAKTKQIKSGRTKAGSQRYECKQCGKRYTPQPKEQGYSQELRLQALRLYVDGMNLRRIARHLGVNHQSVANWMAAYVAQLPAAVQPQQVETVELDELYTFIEHKKSVST